MTFLSEQFGRPLYQLPILVSLFCSSQTREHIRGEPDLNPVLHEHSLFLGKFSDWVGFEFFLLGRI